jgi:hypothetical protein
MCKLIRGTVNETYEWWFLTAWEESECDLSQSATHQNAEEKQGNHSYDSRVLSSQTMCSHWDIAHTSWWKQEGYIYGHKVWWEGFMKYAVEMGSGAMIYIPNFIKIGSAIQKLIHWHRQEGDSISLLRESRLITIIIKCYIWWKLTTEEQSLF